MMICIAPFTTAWARTGAWAKQEGDLDKEQLLFLEKVSAFKEEECHCTWPHPSFWTDHMCGHLSHHRTFSWSPSLCNEGGCCVDHLDSNYCAGICRNRVGCFYGSRSSGDNDASGSSHGCKWQEDEPFSSPSAESSPWVVKDTSHCVGSLALLKKAQEPKRVHGHCFVCFRKLKLIRLWLREEDLFAFLLHRGWLHHSMEVTAMEVAEKLHLTPNKLMHCHERGLLGNAKSTNQLVINVWEPRNFLKEVLNALVKVFLHEVWIVIVGALLAHNIGPLVETNVLKHWPIRLNSVGPSSFLASESWVRIFDLKSGRVNTRKYLGPTCAWSGMTCPVISFDPFSKEILIWSGCFEPSLIELSGMPLALRGDQQVHQLLNWGVTWALRISNTVWLKGWLYVWVLTTLDLNVLSCYNSDLHC